MGLLAAVACGPAELARQEQLTVQGGCGDLFAYAATARGDQVVALMAPGLVEEVRSTGQDLARAFTLPSPSASVKWQVGADASRFLCTDVVEGGWSRPKEVEACAGAVMVRVHPVGPEQFEADVELQDVSFDEGE